MIDIKNLVYKKVFDIFKKSYSKLFNMKNIEIIQRKFDFVQQCIMNNPGELELLVNFLGSLKAHSRKGETFKQYNKTNTRIVKDNLYLYNKYLTSMGRQPLTKKDIEEVYYAFNKKASRIGLEPMTP